MPDYSSVDAAADKAMEDFLNGVSGGEQPTTPPNQVEDDISEDDFAVEDEQPGSPSGGEGGSNNGYTPLAAGDDPAKEPLTPQQLEYERRLAEERGRRAQMQELMQAGVKMAQPEEQPKEVKLFGDDLLTLTPEELATYGDENSDTYKFAEKVSMRVAKQLYEKAVIPLQQQLEQQQQVIQQYGGTISRQVGDAARAQVQAEHPDLPEIVASKEWQVYLDEYVPGSGGTVTNRQLLQTHVGQANVRGLQELVSGFKAKRGVATAQMSPGRSQVSSPPSTLANRQPKKLAYSKYVSAQRRYTEGSLSFDEYAKIERLYDKAFAEDRVDYTK